jgi:hypothetical protein
MKASSTIKTTVFGRTLAATALLSGFLLFAGAPGAAANGYDQCRKNISRAEWKLDEAVERHGSYSRQAERQRHELREAQDRCRYESAQRDRRYRDFNRDRDHDRDRDRH